MDRELLKIWHNINDDYFDGRLCTITDIDWHPLSGNNNLNAFGIYLHRVKSIAIDERFKFDKAKCESQDEAELAKVEIVFRLVLHEMIHQWLHQKGIKRFGAHGDDFIAEATMLSEKLDIDPPAEHNAYCWPNLLPILARYNF